MTSIDPAAMPETEPNTEPSVESEVEVTAPEPATPEPATPEPTASEPTTSEPTELDRYTQVSFKPEGDRLLLVLPPEQEMWGEVVAATVTWAEVWQQLKQRLQGGDRFWEAETEVHLVAGDRLLDQRQLQAIADALKEVELKLRKLYTSRRQTAVMAATAGYSVEQNVLPESLSQPSRLMAEPLYMKTTVRSGVEVRHPGMVAIVGDVNPGGAVIADGDILVWGRLRGVAHAGANGNAHCRILALHMEPTQLRIGRFVARPPDTLPDRFYPEVAYVTPKGIRISRYTDLAKHSPPN